MNSPRAIYRGPAHQRGAVMVLVTVAMLAILAMGGEGGGVLADWLIDMAEQAGLYVQATSVPGVAQRTGATIYYVEIFPGSAARPLAPLRPVPVGRPPAAAWRLPPGSPPG